MFGTNIMMAHAAGFFDGEFKHLLSARRQVDLPAPVLAKAAHFFNHFPHTLRFQT